MEATEGRQSLAFEIILGLVILLLLLLVSLVLHELGHCLAMRRLGVGISQIGFGGGPQLASFKAKSGITYALHLWPFMAYVRSEPIDRLSKSPWQQASISLAGPLVNVLLAALAMSAVLYLTGSEADVMSSPLVAWIPLVLRPLVVGLALCLALVVVSPLLPLVLYLLSYNSAFGFLLGTDAMLQIDGIRNGTLLMATADGGPVTPLLIGLLGLFCLLNLILAGFNLLPIARLDGGRAVISLCYKGEETSETAVKMRLRLAWFCQVLIAGGVLLACWHFGLHRLFLIS
ncbi:site-2 protease family protein [Patescibacteria group bacterium]